VVCAKGSGTRSTDTGKVAFQRFVTRLAVPGLGTGRVDHAACLELATAGDG